MALVLHVYDEKLLEAARRNHTEGAIREKPSRCKQIAVSLNMIVHKYGKPIGSLIFVGGVVEWRWRVLLCKSVFLFCSGIREGRHNLVQRHRIPRCCNGSQSVQVSLHRGPSCVRT